MARTLRTSGQLPLCYTAFAGRYRAEIYTVKETVQLCAVVLRVHLPLGRRGNRFRHPARYAYPHGRWGGKGGHLVPQEAEDVTAIVRIAG